jgi:hypothetical protein
MEPVGLQWILQVIQWNNGVPVEIILKGVQVKSTEIILDPHLEIRYNKKREIQ